MHQTKSYELGRRKGNTSTYKREGAGGFSFIAGSKAYGWSLSGLEFKWSRSGERRKEKSGKEDAKNLKTHRINSGFGVGIWGVSGRRAFLGLGKSLVWVTSVKNVNFHVKKLLEVVCLYILGPAGLNVRTSA